MNIVCYIQEKWLHIGTRLRVSQEKLDIIQRKAFTKGIPHESKNAFCCIKMLKCWHRESKDVSVDTLIKAINAPHVGLESKLPSIEDVLFSTSLDTSKDTFKFAFPPKIHEQPYADMKANFCSELSRYQHLISDAVNICGINKDVIQHIHDFVDLIIFLEKHNHMNNTDLSMLKSIARHVKCTKALEVINKYEVQLMADKTKWYYHEHSLKGTFLVGKIAKKPENVTLKDVSDAKLAASKVVKIEETDSILDFTKMGIVTFYWRILSKDLKLYIPKLINPFVMEHCRASGLTHVGIMTDGSLNITEIEKLQVMEGKVH